MEQTDITEAGSLPAEGSAANMPGEFEQPQTETEEAVMGSHAWLVQEKENFKGYFQNRDSDVNGVKSNMANSANDMLEKLKEARMKCESRQTKVFPGLLVVWGTTLTVAWLSKGPVKRIVQPTLVAGLTSWLFYPDLTCRLGQETLKKTGLPSMSETNQKVQKQLTNSKAWFTAKSWSGARSAQADTPVDTQADTPVDTQAETQNIATEIDANASDPVTGQTD